MSSCIPELLCKFVYRCKILDLYGIRLFFFYLHELYIYFFFKKSLKVRYPHKIAQTAILGFPRFLISGRRFITASSALSEITQWWGRVNGDPKDFWRSSKRWLDYDKPCRGLCQKKCEYERRHFSGEGALGGRGVVTSLW